MGLPVLGFGVPSVDALGAAGNQGIAGVGVTGSLASVPEGHRPAATGPGGWVKAKRRRLSGCYTGFTACTAVLSAFRAAEEAGRLGGDAASTVFGPARGRGPDSRWGLGWEQPGDGPLRPNLTRDRVQPPQGPLARWLWERGFEEALVHWASALQCVPGSGQVTYAELALDFESHSNRALPARPGHRHAPQVLSLWERARVLREAVDLLQPLLTAGTLLEGQFWWILRLLGPSGGLSQHGAHRAAGVFTGSTCGSTCTNCSNTCRSNAKRRIFILGPKILA